MYNVIIADDEAWVSIGIKKLIEKTGLPFQIIAECSNGIAAYREVMEKSPDILISDIRMPGLNGLELLQKLNESNIDLKVIFISGFAEFSYAQTAIQLGAFDYMLKPIEKEAIEAIFNRYIAFREHAEQSVNDPEKNLPVEDPRIIKIIDELKQKYKDEISLGELAEKYGLSIGYLSSLIKKELGLSFTEYITMKRMEDAKRMLMNEALSIDQIAEAVGYNDYFYFTKVFKKYTGISPSKYRKR